MNGLVSRYNTIRTLALDAMSAATEQATGAARSHSAGYKLLAGALPHLEAVTIYGVNPDEASSLPRDQPHMGSSKDCASTSTNPAAFKMSPRRIPTFGSFPSCLIARRYSLDHLRRPPSIEHVNTWSPSASGDNVLPSGSRLDWALKYISII
jgi:hypothetical protein